MKKSIEEFKEFINQGNVVDMAVGVIIGGAFAKIVTSLVDDILMPLIGILIGKVDFSSLAITVGNASIKYGIFIQAIVNFLIISFCIFAMLKLINKMKSKKEAEEEVKEDTNTKLLKDIKLELEKLNKKNS